MITLKQNFEFRRLYYRGRSQVSPLLVTYALHNKRNKKGCRYGITASKKIGNAVERNRARRVIREAFRQLEPMLPNCYDLCFVARKRTCEETSTRVRQVMEKQLRALGLYGPQEVPAAAQGPDRGQAHNAQKEQKV